MGKIYLISAMNKNDVATSDEEIVYKIGVTKQNVEDRIKQLQTGTDKRLDVVEVFVSDFPYKIETALHNIFKIQKENREWFNLTKEDIESFIPLCKKLDQNFNLLHSTFNPFI